MSVSNAFQVAFQHHQAGRLVEAEALYQQVLAMAPNHSDALHLLGVIAQQMGRYELAVERIHAAIRLHPDNPAAHSNLGEAYRKLGRLEEAVDSYRAALALRPNYPEAYNNLGNVLRERGDLDEALVACRRALELKPEYVDAQINLGNVLFRQGRLEEALAEYRRALAQRPNSAEGQFNYGLALTKGENFQEAEAAFRRAIEIQPSFSEACNGLGVTLAGQGRLDEAANAYQQALQSRPDYPDAHNNLGNIFKQLGRSEEAAASYLRALALNPSYADAHTNLGAALADLGQFERAEAEYHRALELRPNNAAAKLNQSLLWLLSGKFEKAWPWYEARWDIKPHTGRKIAQPLYDGGPLNGKRVLFHAEQGFGDTIQFVRYAAFIAANGGDVILECQPPLKTLFQTAEGLTEIVAAGDPLPPFDAHLPMLSAPFIFKTRIETIPGNTPYLSANPIQSAAWQDRVCSASLRIGLAWSGNPENERDRIRNIPLEKLRPLLRVEGTQFFNLQIGTGTEQLSQWADAAAVIDLTKDIHDFADTAALMEHLDLIISVDTAVAHLAGALGHPVWTLLPFVPDWRWGLQGETTLWYPTMRLFRQPAFGDWHWVTQRVQEELELLVKSQHP